MQCDSLGFSLFVEKLLADTPTPPNSPLYLNTLFFLHDYFLYFCSYTIWIFSIRKIPCSCHYKMKIAVITLEDTV